MNPTGIGGFQKDQSGNPGGRPAEIAEVKALAREQTAASIKALVTIRDDATAPANARVAAANSLLDRAWGRPSQAVDVHVVALTPYTGAADQIMERLYRIRERMREQGSPLANASLAEIIATQVADEAV